MRTCMLASDCPAGQTCIDNVCEEIVTGDGGVDAPLTCDDGRPACVAGRLSVCCEADQVCLDGRCATDCGDRALCGGVCCDEGLVCEGTACVADCADAADRCGAADELCCGEGEACLSDACVTLGGPCATTDDCGLDELCDPVLMRCVPRSAVEVCEFIPPVGTFSPTVGCQWRPAAGDNVNSDDVVMTPSVANMTDDNGDGVTDTRDIPDIVFISFDRQRDGCCTSRGRVRIVSGLCNDDGTMNTLGTIAMPFVGNSSGIALGNLHPASMADERNPEIVATFQNGGTIAWRRAAPDGSAWEEMWRNTAYPNSNHTRGGAQPSLADVDGDGAPEVIIGNVVLNGQTGELRWDGRVTVGPGAGVGNNAFLGPTSTVADIDLDGTMEVIAGNTVYDGPTGAEEWTYTYVGNNSLCAGAIRCDGFNGVANFDDDDFGEVVIVRLGEVFVLEHDGTEKYRVRIPRIDCGANESGPPTIADFDGDGRPEIGTASADYYVVVDFDCTGDPLPAECAQENILWLQPNQDCSSRATGSSVFDFEGDGRAEVVYADETNFRIFDGRTGAILYDDPTHRSNTRMEMPIVVDVDNDGKSEVIVPEPNTTSLMLGGIEVWEDADNNWVRTRRIWNQHAYHVTNITEDGQVPADEEENWLNERLNNFRQNVQPGGLFDAPDLFVVRIEVAACRPSGEVDIAVTVGNRGALGVAAGVPVIASVTPEGGAPEALGVQRTTAFLLPGQEETLIFRWAPAGGFTGFRNYSVTARVDDDGMGGSEYNECDETNNEGMSEVFMTCDFG